MKQIDEKSSKQSSSKKSSNKTDLSSNKLILYVFIIVLGLLLILGLLVNHKNSSKLNSYLRSKDFQTYSGSMNSFLTANSGVYPKAFSCQSSLNDLWNPPVSPISKKREKLDVELARQLIDLKPKWEKVSNAFPGYGDFFLFKVLPIDHWTHNKFQNAANLMDRTNALVNHTEDFLYYCPGHLYPGIYTFNYLDEYATKPVTASVSTLNQQMQALADTGNTFRAVKTPTNWTTARSAYLTFLHKTLDDLTALRNERANGSDGADLHAKFAADKKQLEGVLNSAATAGQKIGPNMTDLAKFYKATK